MPICSSYGSGGQAIRLGVLLCQEELVIAVAGIKTSKEEKCARKGISFVHNVCTVVVFNFSDHRERRARYVARN